MTGLYLSGMILPFTGRSGWSGVRRTWVMTKLAKTKSGMIKVLVCGGRKYNLHYEMAEVLHSIYDKRQIMTIIHGDADGADTLAGCWAMRMGIDLDIYPANWNKYGRGAGHIRNAQMLKEGKPDMVVAFPGGRGTENMIGISLKAGIDVWEVKNGKAIRREK